MTATLVVALTLALALGGALAWLWARAGQARLEEQLRRERESASEKLAVIAEAEKRLGDAFQALSADALRRNNQSFLDLAKTSLGEFQKTAKSDLDGRQKAIDQLVVPIRESLQQVDQKLQLVEKERQGHYSALTKQMELMASAQKQLNTETSNLVQALRAPTVRGRWGEIQLRRVVELAGMAAHCDFVEQHTKNTGEARSRPDLVVHLPGGKSVVVDAKVPLEGYLGALECTLEAERNLKLKEHGRQVREHIAKLASKNYWSQFDEAPDFVVMFLPGEVFYSAALEQDPALIEHGVERQVILASPTTLIAMLRAVHYGWNQERLAENAQRISEEGRKLYDRVSTVTGYFEELGKHLDRSVKSYNQTAASLESRVLVAARNLKEMGAGTEKNMPSPKPLEKSPRGVQSSELLPPESPNHG